MSVQYISYTPLSEDELLRIAQTKVAPGYEEQMAIYQQATDKNVSRYETQLSSLEPEYERAVSNLSSQYDQKRQTISDSATARGFGRSSYTTDMLARTHDQQGSDIETLHLKKEAEIQSIGQQIDDLYDQLLTNQARLTSAKQNQILSQIDSLRNEQLTRELEIQKFNSDLAMRESSLQLQRDELAAQQQQWAMQREATKSSSTADDAYRQLQLDFAREQFEYKKEQDALAALQNQRKIEAELEAARLAAEAKAAATSSKSSSKSSSGSKSSSSGSSSPQYYFNGIKLVAY